MGGGMLMDWAFLVTRRLQRQGVTCHAMIKMAQIEETCDHMETYVKLWKTEF